MRIAAKWFDGWPRRRAKSHFHIASLDHLQRFEIGGDVEGLDIRELADAVLLEPSEERAHGPVIGHARVVVLDRGGEKLEEAARRAIAGLGDHRRYGQRTLEGRRRDRRRGLGRHR
jgi:hypothetical protein